MLRKEEIIVENKLDIILENLDKKDNSKEDNFYLTEADFYPPSDNRYLQSYVRDVVGGDNFVDYCEEFFEWLEEEGYYD